MATRHSYWKAFCNNNEHDSRWFQFYNFIIVFLMVAFAFPIKNKTKRFHTVTLSLMHELNEIITWMGTGRLRFIIVWLFENGVCARSTNYFSSHHLLRPFSLIKHFDLFCEKCNLWLSLIVKITVIVWCSSRAIVTFAVFLLFICSLFTPRNKLKMRGDEGGI